MRILVEEGEETELAVRFTGGGGATNFQGVVRGGLGVIVYTAPSSTDAEPIYMEFSG